MNNIIHKPIPHPPNSAQFFNESRPETHRNNTSYTHTYTCKHNFLSDYPIQTYKPPYGWPPQRQYIHSNAPIYILTSPIVNLSNSLLLCSSRPGRPPKRGPVGLSLPATHLSHHPQMKKHRLENGDYPYENGHMNGE